MSMPTLTIPQRRAHWLIRAADYVELTKPRIAALVLATVAVSGFVARWGLDPSMLLALVHALLGTALVAASASAFNQWLERHSDAAMERTADRPLPAGRLTGGEVVAFGGASIVAGTVYLALMVGPLTALLALITWVIYVAVYTPLKTRTSLNTAVGAVAGAMPVLIGWSAVGGRFDMRAAALFSIVFLWQFPHFMAIAWIYRREYARAGLKMLTVVDPTGRRAGVQAVAAALALLPVSFAPALYPNGGVYLVAAFLLGAGQLICAWLFFWRLDQKAARRLLRASLLYLPALLFLWTLTPLV